jgi:ATP-dependent Lon protease
LGEAGGGKSRFARRLGEILKIECWRTDASRSDGAIFGGTDKRRYSAEPCHPFLAIARAKHANPIVLIDEIEKAGTRNDYGRFWDCILGFLEMETSARYFDPALQTPLDLGHVSYVATANALDPLPSPLRDRFRIVTFPKPGLEHIDALLPRVIADLAAERGLDSRWIEPLTGQERDAVAAHWRGGSVRQLRRVVEAVLRAREKVAVRN